MRFSYYIAALIFSIVVSLLLYGNTILGNFVYDDILYLVERSELRQAEQLWKVWIESALPNNLPGGHFRPLTTFTFNLNFVLFGESPVSFHLVNIILNGIVIFLVFLLVQKLFKVHVLSIFIVLFYAFLPIHTEAVANIKARDEILSSLFGILSWVVFLSATEDKKRVDFIKIFLSAFMFLLAVLSKELIIMLPVLFLVVSIFRRKSSWRELFKIGAIFVGTIFLYIIWRYLVLGQYAFGHNMIYFAINPLANAPFWIRIWTAFKIVFIYISKTFVPWDLSATYHYHHLGLVDNLFSSWQALIGLGFLIVLGILAFFKKTKASVVGIGALTFLVSYLMISKLIFKGGDLVAERWMYFPSIGLSFIGGFVVYLFYEKRKWLGIIILAFILLIYSLLIIQRNLVWLSEESLFKSMTKTAPKSVMGHFGLATVYFRNDRIIEAKKELYTAFEIDPKFPPLLQAIGILAVKEDNLALAETAFLKFIEVAPHTSVGYQNAIRLYIKMGQRVKAQEFLEYLNEEEKMEMLKEFPEK